MKKNIVRLFVLVSFLAVHTLSFSAVTYTKDKDYRVFHTDSMPDYTITGFPSRCNPNTALKQDITVKVPLNPQYESRTYELVIPNKFGIMMDGIMIEPNADEYWSADHSTPCQPNDSSQKSAWPYAALSQYVNFGFDQSNAHVQPSGLYHYHGLPLQYMATLNASRDHQIDSMPILGYAADGFPIYANRGYKDPQDSSSPIVTLKSSYQLKSGARPQQSDDAPGGSYDGRFTTDYEYIKGSGDLDECNGRMGVTPDYPKGTYYYVITADYPWVGRCFHAKPDESFSKIGGGEPFGPPRGRGPKPMPPNDLARP